MTDETKAAIRAVWEAQPGLASGESGGLNCAYLCMPSEICLLSEDEGLDWRDVYSCNDAFLPEDGVTPEERRDCMIEMLMAGAFDDLEQPNATPLEPPK